MQLEKYIETYIIDWFMIADILIGKFHYITHQPRLLFTCCFVFIFFSFIDHRIYLGAPVSTCLLGQPWRVWPPCMILSARCHILEIQEGIVMLVATASYPTFWTSISNGNPPFSSMGSCVRCCTWLLLWLWTYQMLLRLVARSVRLGGVWGIHICNIVWKGVEIWT